MHTAIQQFKKIIGDTDYPVKDSNLNDAIRQALNQPSAPFGFRESTTAGLTLGLFGGELSVDGALTTIADTTVNLTGSEVNYVEHDRAGAVTKNAVGFSADKFPVAEVTTDAGSITAYVDRRNANTQQMEGKLVLAVGGGAGTTVLTAAQCRNQIVEFTGALTGNRVIEWPTRISGPRVVHNNTSGAFTVTVKTNAGAGKAVRQGKHAVLYCDGVNIDFGFDDPDAAGAPPPFPSGTRLLFQQTSAPAGWTKEVSANYNDAALRFTTGTVGTGGADAFTTHFGAGKAAANHTITSGEHPGLQSLGFSIVTQNSPGTGGTTAIDGSSSFGASSGGGGPHDHTLNNFNVKFADCIIAAKD